MNPLFGREFTALTQQFRDVCEDAVDDLDVAVALEATGLNDATAASRYGVSGVLELAGELMTRMPTRVKNAQARRTVVRVAYVRLLSRGLLYALPGLFYLVLAHVVSSRSATLYLITSMLCGWAISQIIAVVAYRMLPRTGPRNVSRMLRRCLLISPPIAGVVLVAASVVGSTTAAGVALAQVLYVVAATVLLFYDADKLLALALGPSAAISLVFLVHWPFAISNMVAIIAIGFVVPAALVAAYVASSPAKFGTKAEPYLGPLASEVAKAGPFAVYGLLSGVIVAYRPIWILATRPHHIGSALDITILPLVLSMGYAEIELLWLRSAGGKMMRQSRSLVAYRTGIRRLLILTEVRFALVLAGLSITVVAGMHYTGGLDADVALRLTAYLAAGCAFIAALIVIAVDQVVAALRAFAAAGAAALVVAAGLAALGSRLSPDASYLGICVILFACLWWTALRTLRNPLHLA